MFIWLLLGLLGLFIIMFKNNTSEYFWDQHRTNYNTYKDSTLFAYNQQPAPDSNSMYFKQQYHTKMQPKCIKGVNGDSYCPKINTSAGFFKTLPGYFDDNRLLNSFSLGYDITGIPYNNYQYGSKAGKFAKSKKIIDLEHPKQRLYNKKWLDYSAQKETNYIGYPFYFHGKSYR